MGCSYKYNTGRLEFTQLPMEDPEFGMAGKNVSWVPEPAKFILLHEPPARAYEAANEPGRWFVHWHFAQGQTDVRHTELQRDPQRFISTVLFPDGHCASHDFTRSIQNDPLFPYEPTANWIWYKPAAAY